MAERINPVIREGEQNASACRPVAPKEVRTVTINNERELLLE
jgi:hypothetical protein